MKRWMDDVIKSVLGWILWHQFEAVIIVLVIGFAAFIGAAVHEDRAMKPKQYSAWCKQTGNPKHLTFEEWKLLLPHQTSDVLVMPVIIAQ